MTKALAVAVSLYYFLAPGSMEYPMPYAFCLASWGVVECCSIAAHLVWVSWCCSYIAVSACPTFWPSAAPFV